MLALEGRQLGNYDVIRRIRVGGMGAVYEGRQRTAFGRRVAIKVILGNYADDPEMRRRFAREARIVARLHHPHILPLIEFGDEQGLLYLVMPFIEGGTLTSYLRRSLPDLSDVAAVFLQLLDAVEYAHDEGLIHRDIKSSNVLLEQRRSGPPYAYLADFGLVRTSRQAEFEQAGISIPLDQVPGTPHYMAPEQTRGIVTPLTDIYALGVLLYQMLVGELPYEDADEVRVIKMHLYASIPSPSEHDASIPVELGEVVRTAMAKRAEDRFGSVAQLREAFLAAIDRPVATVNEDVLSVEEVVASPGRPISLPLTPSPPLPPEPFELPALLESPESPVPILIPRRSRRTAAPVPMRVKRPTTKTTKVLRERRKRFALSVVAAIVVPLLLLILLIMPRVLGVSFFPAGFPLFGASPVATVSITPQSKTLQDTYLLTASPQASGVDLVLRIIPDRVESTTSSGSSTIATTGTQSTPGAQASGLVFFDNSGKTPVSVTEGTTFTTNSGIQISLTQTVMVEPRQDGQDGIASATAVAISAGAAGNISAYALNTSCCGGKVTASNPEPFTSGVDASVVHVVTQADLDGVKNTLGAKLQQQALQQLQKQLYANEVLAGKPTYTMKVSSNNPVGAQANQVKVQVSLSATVAVYNDETARQVAAQLLSKQAMQTLDNNANDYQLSGTPSAATPVVEQQGPDGKVYLSVAVHELWVYHFSSLQLVLWRQSIKGLVPAVALAYLNSQTGVAAVHISLPFGSDHLPPSVDNIKIDLVNE